VWRSKLKDEWTYNESLAALIIRRFMYLKIAEKRTPEQQRIFKDPGPHRGFKSARANLERA
jgi:hypothetical protein